MNKFSRQKELSILGYYIHKTKELCELSNGSNKPAKLRMLELKLSQLTTKELIDELIMISFNSPLKVFHNICKDSKCPSYLWFEQTIFVQYATDSLVKESMIYDDTSPEHQDMMICKLQSNF